MILLTNSTAQTLAPGESVSFDTVLIKTGFGECHRKGSNAVKLHHGGVYEIHFNANVGGTVADSAVGLTIMLGDERLTETGMVSVPAIANTEYNNVAATTAVRNCCCDYDRITVMNTAATTILIDANPALLIHQIS